MVRGCQTCLKIIKDPSEGLYISSASFDSDTIPLKEKLEDCVPELILDSIDDAVLCHLCIENLTLAYKFKQTCLESQQKIYDFLQQVPNDTRIDTGKIATYYQRMEIIEEERNPKLIDTHSNTTECPKMSYNCKMCSFSCLDKCVIRQHEVLHKNKYPPYKCDECASIFPSSLLLLDHLATHCKEQPYACTICDFITDSYKQFKNHGWIHRKAFQCNFCWKRFSHRYDLDIHMESHEYEQALRRFQCGWCEFKCDDLKTLECHSDNDHQDTFKCEICTVECRNSSALTLHKKCAHKDLFEPHPDVNIYEDIGSHDDENVESFNRVSDMSITTALGGLENTSHQFEGLNNTSIGPCINNTIVNNVMEGNFNLKSYPCNNCNQFVAYEDYFNHIINCVGTPQVACIVSEVPSVTYESPPVICGACPTFLQAPPTSSQPPSMFPQNPPMLHQTPPICIQAPPSLSQPPSVFPQNPPMLLQTPPICTQTPPIIPEASSVTSSVSIVPQNTKEVEVDPDIEKRKKVFEGKLKLLDSLDRRKDQYKKFKQSLINIKIKKSVEGDDNQVVTIQNAQDTNLVDINSETSSLSQNIDANLKNINDECTDNEINITESTPNVLQCKACLRNYKSRASLRGHRRRCPLINFQPLNSENKNLEQLQIKNESKNIIINKIIKEKYKRTRRSKKKVRETEVPERLFKCWRCSVIKKNFAEIKEHRLKVHGKLAKPKLLEDKYIVLKRHEFTEDINKVSEVKEKTVRHRKKLYHCMQCPATSNTVHGIRDHEMKEHGKLVKFDKKIVEAKTKSFKQ